MTLGSLSADGWGCVPVLLVVWHEVSSTGVHVLGYGWVNASRLGGGDAGEREAPGSGSKKLDEVFPRLPGP